MQCLPLLRAVVQWSQPLNYSPAGSTSSSHLIIMPLISCSNWSLPLKYDSTIWSFIKKLFFWNCWERFCVLKKKKPAVCSVGEDWEEIREERKEGEKRRQVVPIITHFCVGEPEVVPGPQPPPPTRPALRLSSTSQSSKQPWQRGRGTGLGQATRQHFQTLPLLVCV